MLYHVHHCLLTRGLFFHKPTAPSAPFIPLESQPSMLPFGPSSAHNPVRRVHNPTITVPSAAPQVLHPLSNPLQDDPAYPRTSLALMTHLGAERRIVPTVRNTVSSSERERFASSHLSERLRSKVNTPFGKDNLRQCFLSEPMCCCSSVGS